MSDFEREMVQCLNRFFRHRQIPGFAYRARKLPGTDRTGDVLADSPHTSYNLSLECISIKDKKLYFSQHFHASASGIHPVDAFSGFLAETGRTGYLAIEFRQGQDSPAEAFLIPWETVAGHFDNNTGISLEEARNHLCLGRTNNGYCVDRL